MPRTKSAKTVSTTSTPSEPKKRGRIPAQLNISVKPGVGMAYVIRRLSDNVLVRASTTCQRDKIDENSKMFGKPLCQYSGSAPYFTMKLGAAKVGAKIIKMLCSPSLPHCEDTKNEYRFEGVSLKDALAKKLDVDQSEFYVSKDAPAVKAPKAKKEKVVVVKTKKVAKVSKKKAKAVIAAPTSTPADAPNVIFSNASDSDVENTAEKIVESAVEVPTAKDEESQAEFESSINEDFEKELAKAQAKAQS